MVQRLVEHRHTILFLRKLGRMHKKVIYRSKELYLKCNLDPPVIIFDNKSRIKICQIRKLLET